MRALRRALEISQADVGRDLGLSQAFIAELESGRKTPSLKTALAIAKLTAKWPEGPVRPEEWSQDEPQPAAEV